MILFVNVFITDERMVPEKYPLLSKQKVAHSKLDIFKYTLASYSAIPWEGAIFYIKLDTKYEPYRDELKKFIIELFPENTEIYPYRLDSYEQWVNAIQLPNYSDNTQIWFTCNDDHVFIDSSLNSLNKLLESASQTYIQHNKEIAIFPSHWQEMMAAKKRSIYLQNKLYRRWSKPNISILNENRNYYLTTSKDCCSIQIITKKLLTLWFSKKNIIPESLRRTDEIFLNEEHVTIVPFRELFRHLDAYSHSFLPFETVPIMFIPQGFFEKKINIQYGGDKRIPGYVYIHPEKKMYSNQLSWRNRTSDDFCDTNIPLDEIPLFWKDRIDNVVVNEISDKIIFKSYITQKIKEVCADPRFGYTPSEAIRKVTAAFCQKYEPSMKELKAIVKSEFGIKGWMYYRCRMIRYSYLLNPWDTFNACWKYHLLTFIRLKYPSAWAKAKKLKEIIRIWKKKPIQA